jgi:hypothetical protein
MILNFADGINISFPEIFNRDLSNLSEAELDTSIKFALVQMRVGGENEKKTADGLIKVLFEEKNKREVQRATKIAGEFQSASIAIQNSANSTNKIIMAATIVSAIATAVQAVKLFK